MGPVTIIDTRAMTMKARWEKSASSEPGRC